MATLVEHADALREIVTDLSTLTVQKLVAFFRQAGDRDKEEMYAFLREALPAIVGPHAQAAATITAQWYDELAPTAAFHASPVVDLDEAKIDGTTRWALYAPGDAAPLDRLAGATKRWVADASRDTVTANAAQEGVRYARHAAPDACAFCRLLATRTSEEDGLYQSAWSALRVVGSNGRPKGSRKLGDKYHDHCRCVAVPVRSDQAYDPPDYVMAWQDQYIEARNEVGGDTKKILAHMRAADGGDAKGRTPQTGNALKVQDLDASRGQK